MNWQQLQKSKGKYVKIRPVPKRFKGAEGSPELGTEDDDWIIDQVADDSLQIRQAAILAVVAKVGRDHIHSYTSNPMRGSGHGFLNLTVQLNIGGNDVWIEPVSFLGAHGSRRARKPCR